MKDLLKALSRKGARETLEQLVESPKRFKDLAGALKSRRTLSKRLKELEDESLIEREVTRDRPPATLYTLTRKGERALDIVSKLEKVG